MLFTRTFFAISCIALSVVKAAPIFSTTYKYVPDAGFLLTESLSEYYENIVDQVMLDVSEDVLSFIPQSISQGDVQARQLAQKSLNRNLDFMRASLLASVNPLVSTDIPQIAGLTEIQKESVLSFSEERVSQENQEEMEANLLDSILALNKKMSHQLGLIVNAEQSSSILIRQATATSIKQTENTDPSSVITVEWKLRQPFQINVVREQKVQVDDVTTESDWLYQQLSSVELNLLNEFNDRAQEAVLLVLESLALDI